MVNRMPSQSPAAAAAECLSQDVGAVVWALASLLAASHSDAPPDDRLRDAWRERVANALAEYDRMRETLRAIGGGL